MDTVHTLSAKPAGKLPVVYISAACCDPSFLPIDQELQHHLKQTFEILGVYVDIYIMHLRQMAVFIKAIGETNPLFRDKLLDLYQSVGRNSFPAIIIRDSILLFNRQVPGVENLIQRLKPLVPC